MGQLSDALEVAGRQLESRFRQHREGMLSSDLARALPQSWRFETESESAVLRIDATARVRVVADVVEPPAVIVKWTQRELIAALLSGRSNEQARPHPPAIRFTTDAGRKAFSLLGTSLGL